MVAIPKDIVQMQSKGNIAKKFSRLNSNFIPGQTLVMDEYLPSTWDAIYICGVSTNGYAQHKNYPHNVHIAVIPKEGASDHWEFENWMMEVQNGVFEHVISEKELDEKYKNLPEQFTTCRMFRWAVTHYKNDISEQEKSVKINEPLH